MHCCRFWCRFWCKQRGLWCRFWCIEGSDAGSDASKERSNAGFAALCFSLFLDWFWISSRLFFSSSDFAASSLVLMHWFPPFFPLMLPFMPLCPLIYMQSIDFWSFRLEFLSYLFSISNLHKLFLISLLYPYPLVLYCISSDLDFWDFNFVAIFNSCPGNNWI